jgi:hypothetical protein
MTNFARCRVRSAHTILMCRTTTSLLFPCARLFVFFALLVLLDVRATAQDNKTARASFNEAASQLIEGPLFRLGDAAAPFGWSTIIGDFDTDGRPDVAVADHAGRSTGRYEYRLEFRVSGQRWRHVTFVSVHDAVTIRAADVDRDDDLDVIIGVPLTGETIAVWINDGHGNFSAGTTHQVPAGLGAVGHVQADDSTTSLAMWNSSDQRSTGCRLSALRSPPVLVRTGLAHLCTSLFRRSRFAADANPRAPPSISPSTLS